ncbi:hypothetical protein AI2848V1_1550 [Klebsiella pneumoniae]|nr:hypothetical protein AI2848V1_1550 [Klebsiella pneumoniae]CAH5159829.1 hypothetical protein AI2848V1_1550 [Klebsiella pneumoniae]
MTNNQLNRERLEKIKSWRETYGAGSNVILPAEEAEELARIALATMDGEPVAWTWHYREQWHVTNDERRAEFVAKDGDVAVLPLYRHAQPAPEKYNIGDATMRHIFTPTGMTNVSDMQAVFDRVEAVLVGMEQPAPVVPDDYQRLRELYHAQEKRLFKITQRIKGPTFDKYAHTPSQAIDVLEEALFGNDAPLCHSVMLAAAPQLPGSEPATLPGKWIPVSEQVPPGRHEVLVGRWWGEKPRWCCKWATYIPGHPDAQSSGWLIPGASWTPTHWMPLPAAPQEVNRE